MTDPVFVVGDIHGHLEQLETALDWIAQDECAGAPIVFTGDFIDRGPNSSGVLDRLIDGQASGLPWTCLLGNHDDYMRRFLGPDPEFPADGSRTRWFLPQVGGLETLKSYGVDVDETDSNQAILERIRPLIPRYQIEWLESLPRLYETGDHVFVHAGIRPGVSLNDQNPEDLLWIRGEFLDDPRDHGRLVVHGHTAIDQPAHYGNRVNVDGGTGWGNPLYPVLLLGREAFMLGPSGRVRLEPLPGVKLA